MLHHDPAVDKAWRANMGAGFHFFDPDNQRFHKSKSEICELIQTIRGEVDQQALDEMREDGYGPGFRPDGTEMTDALIRECEDDIVRVREIVARYVARRDSKRARLEALAQKAREIVGLL